MFFLSYFTKMRSKRKICEERIKVNSMLSV